jgi:hypothetical protein
MVGILFTCGKHLYGLIISLKGGVGLEFIALYLDIFTSLMSSDLNIEQFQRTIFGKF